MHRPAANGLKRALAFTDPIGRAYHGSKTHLSLDKDAPEPRAREAISDGNVITLPMVSGLHHRYTRRAA